MKNLSSNPYYIYGYSENISDLLSESLNPGNLSDLNEWSYQNQKINNPKITFFEQRIAALEGGVSAMAVKSFYLSKILVIKNLVRAGENVVTYNSTILYTKDQAKLKRLGIEVRIPEDRNLNSFKNLVDDSTKLIYLETIGIEDHSIPDFQKIIALAKDREIPVLVDNTAGAAGYLVKPIKLGANIVIESTKNWLPSHRNIIGAVIIDGGNYNWRNGKFPQFTKSYLNIDHENEKESEETKEFISISLINYFKKQGNINYNKYEIPSNPFSLIYDLEQIPLIVQEQNNKALILAQWLKNIDLIKEVNYTGLPSQKSYFSALTYFKNGFGHELTFSIKDETENKRIIQLLVKSDPSLERSFHLKDDMSIKISTVDLNLEYVKEILQKIFDQSQSNSILIEDKLK